jgi:hypothetical protein
MTLIPFFFQLKLCQFLCLPTGVQACPTSIPCVLGSSNSGLTCLLNVLGPAKHWPLSPVVVGCVEAKLSEMNKWVSQERASLVT